MARLWLRLLGKLGVFFLINILVIFVSYKAVLFLDDNVFENETPAFVRFLLLMIVVVLMVLTLHWTTGTVYREIQDERKRGKESYDN